MHQHIVSPFLYMLKNTMSVHKVRMNSWRCKNAIYTQKHDIESQNQTVISQRLRRSPILSQNDTSFSYF